MLQIKTFHGWRATITTLIRAASERPDVYSLNAPVPPAVARLASGLASQLRTADARTRHTLMVKRLGDGRFAETAQRAREALAGAPACEARVTGVGCFETPPDGRGPVVYLAVESPGLLVIHTRLCEAFDPVEGVEGDEYVPHITIARRGDAPRLAGREVEPVTWTVDRLEFWDADHREVVESVSLAV